ncbi:MAG: hypothetical protein IJ491_01865 [Clostridia bacterium]|nr:hypothetical protein [Clostridia bacterium]
MKKIISLILAAVLLVSVAVIFAACGNNDAGNEIKNDVTSMMDGATTLMDEVSEGLSDLADDLTENGNVTDESGADNMNDGTTNQAGTTGEGLLGGEDDTQTTVAE